MINAKTQSFRLYPSCLFFIIAILFLIACRSRSGNNAAHKLGGMQGEFDSLITACFGRLDAISLMETDSLEKANKDIVEAIGKYRQTIFTLPDTADFDRLYIAKSADGNLCLLSWDTRMGGTNIEFESVAVYRTGTEIQAYVLADSENAESSNTFIHYDRIYTIPGSKGPLYLAEGFGQGSTALPWQELRAMEISDNLLINPAIFPGNKSRLFAEFDTHAFHAGDTIPSIKLDGKDRTIQMPVPDANGGFSGRYEVFIYKDSHYHRR